MKILLQEIAEFNLFHSVKPVSPAGTNKKIKLIYVTWVLIFTFELRNSLIRRSLIIKSIFVC